MGDFGDGRLLSWPGAPMILSEAKCRFFVGIYWVNRLVRYEYIL